jgi:hypothetical protein
MLRRFGFGEDGFVGCRLAFMLGISWFWLMVVRLIKRVILLKV